MRQSLVCNFKLKKCTLKKCGKNTKCQVIIYTTQDDEINEVRNKFENF